MIYLGDSIDVLQLILLAMVTLTLIISFLTWKLQRSEHRISRIKYGKEWARGRLITLKTELEEISRNPEKNKSRLKSPIFHEIVAISDVLSNVGLVVPSTLINTIDKEDFFNNRATLREAIIQIRDLLRDLG